LIFMRFGWPRLLPSPIHEWGIAWALAAWASWGWSLGRWLILGVGCGAWN
jgi:hypothetical protein